jgi:biotin carboxyl carrier protein
MKNFKFKIDNRTYTVDIENINGNLATVNVNGVLYEVEVDKKLKTAKPVMPRKDFVPPTSSAPSIVKPVTSGNGNTIIRSPLPGKVINISVKVGDKVTVGQTVICIEAMKMENNIRTDKEGVVKAIHVETDAIVIGGDALLQIDDWSGN